MFEIHKQNLIKSSHYTQTHTQAWMCACKASYRNDIKTKENNNNKTQ